MRIFDQIYWSQREPESTDYLWIHSINGIYHIQIYEAGIWHDLSGECNNIDKLLINSKIINNIQDNITNLENKVTIFEYYKNLTSLPEKGNSNTLYLIGVPSSDFYYQYDKYIWLDANNKYERVYPKEVSFTDYKTEALVGEQDGDNQLFETKYPYISNKTGKLYLNGVRLFLDEDYEEVDNTHIQFITYIPKPTDKLRFEAIYIYK